MKRSVFISAFVVGGVVCVLLWIAGSAIVDYNREQDIAAADAQIFLFHQGRVFGEKGLLLRLQRNNKIEPDTSTVRVVGELQFVFDSLIWERDRIGNDTLKMPERTKP